VKVHSFDPDFDDLGFFAVGGLDENLELLAAPNEAAGLVRETYGLR
jgi:hypothetical protein